MPHCQLLDNFICLMNSTCKWEPLWQSPGAYNELILNAKIPCFLCHLNSHLLDALYYTILDHSTGQYASLIIISEGCNGQVEANRDILCSRYNGLIHGLLLFRSHSEQCSSCSNHMRVLPDILMCDI